MDYEAIVIGGSYAGLSAALQLARARRRVLVIDDGRRRNRFAETSHGFLTRDGERPEIIAGEARSQLMAYPTVEWLDARADDARKSDTGFSVTSGGRELTAKRLVLAVGVKDHLPEIPGLTDRWGKSVFHCPYCHGYELNRGQIGVIGVSAMSMHHALMLPDWGPTTLLLNDAFRPDEEQAGHLAARGVTVEETPISSIGGHAEVLLQDGRGLSFAGLFVLSRTELASPIAEQLGCALEDGPVGKFIRTDMTQQTSIPGVFACGDAARAAGSVAISVGDGAMAGAGTHRSLMFG
ncbi:FAD-dependent pyridine nucleotide-disulfide oxidoreductase [Neorhizobium galegae bv. officinalis]|uniref:Thioredoxin reductase n=1 Tax=Neorhizobium galegae bv. officinalis TaxID=323656 RepID=A0A0T7F8E7_NEOGA|nr:NAD(P)/FAD-dependent oxidoreductase [Neorhizobium galegae]CDZ31285.1 FAD-dependent pyridine nucleotide-disulfide oxidoreductase [Neorhizobium galegae bv. officinalis]